MQLACVNWKCGFPQAYGAFLQFNEGPHQLEKAFLGWRQALNFAERHGSTPAFTCRPFFTHSVCTRQVGNPNGDFEVKTAGLRNLKSSHRTLLLVKPSVLISRRILRWKEILLLGHQQSSERGRDQCSPCKWREGKLMMMLSYYSDILLTSTSCTLAGSNLSETEKGKRRRRVGRSLGKL